MKFCILLGLLMLVNYSEQLTKFVHCNEGIATEPSLQNTCTEVTCYGDALQSKACPEATCEEGKKHVGTREGDVSKLYPECCGGPICE